MVLKDLSCTGLRLNTFKELHIGDKRTVDISINSTIISVDVKIVRFNDIDISKNLYSYGAELLYKKNEELNKLVITRQREELKRKRKIAYFERYLSIFALVAY